MYLASGTDEEYMKEEARLLDVERYFDGGVYGALDDYKSFSKGILIRRILDSAEFRGEEFLGFGDGFVEIEEVKKVGGVAVGAATAEPECRAVDQWKRSRLIGVGADVIVPNYCERDTLLADPFPRDRSLFMSSTMTRVRRPCAGLPQGRCPERKNDSRSRTLAR